MWVASIQDWRKQRKEPKTGTDHSPCLTTHAVWSLYASSLLWELPCHDELESQTASQKKLSVSSVVFSSVLPQKLERQTHQCSEQRIKKEAHKSSQLVFHNGKKQRNDSPFNKWSPNNWTPLGKLKRKWKCLDIYLSPIPKITSMWTRDSNAKFKTTVS